MTGESLNIKQDQLEKLKQLFPEVISEGNIDWEKLQATLGKENIEFRNERYVLNWAGKTDAFKVLQQSTTATLKPVPEESINFDTTENVFIEGENMEVLKVLQKAYYNKIKCIIIDPPYNTGSDSFIYPDSFKESKEDYQKRIGEKDEEGYLMKEGFFRKNSKDSGHYHSNWLSMMYPRLFLAKNLLRDDGVIFVHIDDNEVHNLRLIMNEIFGEENFVEQVVWKKRYGAGGGTKGFAKLHEYILLFTKRPLQNIEAPLTEEQIDEYKNKDEKYHKRGGYITQPLATSSKGERTNLSYTISHNGNEIKPEPGSRWLWSKEKFDKAYLDNEIIINETNGKFSVRVKQYLKDEFGKIRNGKPLSIQIGTYNQEGTKEVAEVLGKKGIFDFPKPITLVKYLLSFIVNDDLNRDGIYLDFFGGSGTTAQAVLELNKENEGNRKFILVQLPEKCDESSEAYKAGYKTIADIAKERIRRVIKKIENEKQKAEKKKGLFADKGNEDNQSNHGSDNGFKVFKLSSSNFKIWRGDEITEENLKAQLDAFTNPVREGSEKENMLYELILKAGYLLTDKVEAKGNYYSINDGELIIALEEMNQKLIETIIYAKPKKVITLDKLFIGNDQMKTNTVLQMRDAEIDFKTI